MSSSNKTANDTKLVYFNVEAHDSLDHSEFIMAEKQKFDEYYGIFLAVFVMIFFSVLLTTYYMWKTLNNTPHVRKEDSVAKYDLATPDLTTN